MTRAANPGGPGDHLLITFKNNSQDQITVLNFFAEGGDWAVNLLKFNDGSAMWLSGGGMATNRPGDDIFVFGRGFGHQTCQADGAFSSDPEYRDVVRLWGLNRGDLEYSVVRSTPPQSNRNTFDLIIRIKDTGETFTIVNALTEKTEGSTTYVNVYNSHIDAFEFGDGSVVEWDDFVRSTVVELTGTAANDNLKASPFSTIIRGLGGHDTLTGIAADDVLYGDDGNDRLEGGDDNDYLYGEDGDDLLYGGNGDDRLYGGTGDDLLDGGAGDLLLDGGAGNDILDGGTGSDTYVYGRGYGNDTISSADSTAGKRDVIRLVGLTLADVEFLTARNGSSYHHLIIRIRDTGETLTVTNAIYNSTSRNNYSIEAIEFGNGTVMEWAELETSGLLMMQGSEGADSLAASPLGTTMYGYGGNDTLNGGAGNDILYGGEGNDILNGGAGNDILTGRAGNDTLCGGAGDDTYIFGWGDGQDTINNTGSGNDLLKFTDVDPAELWFGKSGNHLVISLIGGTDKVTVNNWYARCKVPYCDGTVHSEIIVEILPKY